MRLTLALFVTALGLFLISPLRASNDSGFGIFFVDRKGSLAESLIDADDLVRYAWNHHSIELTRQALERVRAKASCGQLVAICVDRKPIYRARLYRTFCQTSCNDVVLLISEARDGNFVQLQLGYPTSKWFKGSDPRSALVVHDALLAEHKLWEN
jgi:hypothetical protein